MTVAAAIAPAAVSTAARELVAGLALRGLDRIFCVAGEGYLRVLDALYDTPEIDVVTTRHEGSAAFMAATDAKLAGRVGFCLVNRGPGRGRADAPPRRPVPAGLRRRAAGSRCGGSGGGRGARARAGSQREPGRTARPGRLGALGAAALRRRRAAAGRGGRAPRSWKRRARLDGGIVRGLVTSDDVVSLLVPAAETLSA